MIHCTINGQAAYPSASDKIKVTYANQYIEDSGSYTYDISFPMSIHANQVLFANIHRFDVHKRSKSFDDCKLYADNRLFISGKGTITSVSDTRLSGASRASSITRSLRTTSSTRFLFLRSTLLMASTRPNTRALA